MCAITTTHPYHHHHHVDHYCHSKHTGAISDRHSQPHWCVSTLRAISVCVQAGCSHQWQDHPPALVRPIHVSLASVGGQLIGFHYQHLSAASMSALPPPPGEVKVLGSDSWRPVVRRRRRWAECNEDFRTGAAKQIMSQNLRSAQLNRLIIELLDLGALLRIWGLISNIDAGSFF